MRYALIVLLLNALTVTALFAKKTYTITGSLYDVDLKEPLIQASVRVLNATDSTVVTGAVSDGAGNFKIANVRGGDYIAHFSFLGMSDVYKSLALTGTPRTVDLGRIDMTTASIAIGDVVVTGKAAEVMVRNDTLEYNAASYKTQEGAVMEDLLKKMPGVEVATDGKVTVNGKEVKKVFIDGKEFFGNDPTVATKNLPVEMIEKVQVLDRKSDMARMTGFNDDEEETVINITVKPEKKRGWFGSILGGGGFGFDPSNQGYYEGNVMINRFIGNNQFSILGGANNTNNMGFNDFASTMFQGMGGGGGRRGGGWRGPGNGLTKSRSLGINFSTEINSKLTLGGDASYSGSGTFLTTKSNQQNFLPSGTQYYNERNKSNNNSNNLAANFKLEWKPDTLTQLIFTPRFAYNLNSYNEDGTLSTVTEAADSINRGTSGYDSNGKGGSFSGNLDFSRKLNSKGRVLSASLRGSYNDATNDGINRSDMYYYKDGIVDSTYFIDQRFNYNNNGYSYRGSVSWVEPLGRRNYMQFSYRISNNHSEAIKNTFNELAAVGGVAPLDSAYSRSSLNNTLRQRAGIAFKSERDKFNYTLGVNLDPTTSRTQTFVGNDFIDSLDFTRKVINLSPQVQFRYNFDKRTYLRIDAEGRTNQPSMSQLQPVRDISDPLNVITGNPDLKPSYNQNFSAQFQLFKPESQFSLVSYLNGGLVVNDIVSTSTYNPETGQRISTYDNINGNWNGSLAVIINSPLKNKKFTISSFTRTSYTHRKGWVDRQENTANTVFAMEGGRFNYRSDLFDVGINGMVRYNNTVNSFSTRSNRQTFDYNAGATTTIYLPLNFTIDSDINYNTNSGYADGYKINTWIWNASLSKQFLKNKQATVRIKAYDMLNQRSSVNRSVTADYIRDTEYNTLGRYFMLYFVYRFNTFGDGKVPGQAQSGDPQFPAGPPRRAM